MPLQLLHASLSLALLSLMGTALAQNSSLPIVDLGYQLQQATLFNSTGGFYNFSNIRYAAPPTGKNRFDAPQPPAVNRSGVQQGLPDRICAQAAPAWLAIAAAYLPKYFGGQTNFNASSFNTRFNTSNLPAQDPRTTEDCLFLDVIVPEKIFNNAGKGHGAPVLVWIHGGGYSLGSKSDSGNPAGLIARSQDNSKEGIVYVSLNYRLGAFGWLSGPSFQETGVANAALLDQRLALEWVQNHIAKFGGDPKRVTVLGESAGGASIMHQITAYGGLRGPAPFQQAIIQSPGFLPMVSHQKQESTFQAYLTLLNVSSLEQARGLTFTQLQKANIIQIGQSSYGEFTYGPVVDGNFTPALPGELLLHGQYDHNLKVMVGHNAHEGLLFTNPFIQNKTALVGAVLSLLPTVAAWPLTMRYILETLYPPIFDGSQASGYTDEITRAAALLSDVVFACNTFWLDEAFGNKTYGYYFAVPPALHGGDIPYTYYNGGGTSLMVLSTSVAITLQEYITTFAETGSPNGAGTPYFQVYGRNATVQDLNITGISQIVDPAANSRCDWWQKALYV
ncbi:putative type-B carboxylesterase lipase family protein [Teratosphaeria destructans]|uniref:Carboxylic ester hydrolase n=1 Tax=Teratosphaeria destructans TaxID=418781 RepID=A0A9W7SUL2_9PEZI|nr:putative type-B carboxylesterase lipase family protein [Teratosphaeria destructans]